MGEPVVRAVDVAKSYGSRRVLDGVSIAVEAGEVYGLVGPNGAGKTTFVRGVTGTVSVEGSVELFGEPPGAVARSRIGVLPQSFSPAGRLTARELVAYYAGLYDETRSVEAVLRDVGLDAAAGTAYETLSGGQQRRLCVATALVNDPELLVVDEPTTGIDPAGRRAVWGVIERLAAEGTAVLLTSHSMTEIERLADRVGLLRDGALIADGTPAALIDRHGGPPQLKITVGDPGDTHEPIRAGEPSPEPTVEQGSAVERAAARLSAAGHQTRTDDTAVWVEGVEPTAIASVVESLGETVPVRSITWREPGLEDAYLRLAGEPFEGASRATADRSEQRRATADGEPDRAGADR